MATEEFLGSSQLKTLTNWQERALYKEEALDQYENLKLSDSWYGNPFYGKIDPSGYAIFPKEERLVQVDSPNTVMVFDFVEQAYKNFYNTYLLSLSAKYGIKDYNSNLVNFSPLQGFKSVHELYQSHQQDLYSLFLSFLDANVVARRKVCTLDKFLKYYFEFLQKMIVDFPITKISFIKSTFCPTNISGLVLEINEDLSHDEDEPKNKKFLQDPLFDDYVRHSVRYGFSIDKNAPWRLTTRIGSSPMKKFISNFSVENMFDRYYYRAYKSEFDNFKLSAVQFYNSFQALRPSYTKANYSSKTGKVMVNKIERQYADEDTASSISNMFWLEKYYGIRMMEEGYSLTPFQMKNNLQHIKRTYKKNGQEAALDFMEKKFIKLQKLAIPAERKKYFNYGALNTQSVIYEESKNNSIEQQNSNSY